jgi:hypothetical protein
MAQHNVFYFNKWSCGMGEDGRESRVGEKAFQSGKAFQEEAFQEKAFRGKSFQLIQIESFHTTITLKS